jgi:hypothetical protein
MDALGYIHAVEEEIALASLPANVRDGLTKAAGIGQIVKSRIADEGAIWLLS